MVLNVHRRRDKKRCQNIRVWLNGVEVTRHCFYADGRRGVVRLSLYVRRDGHYVVDLERSRIAVEELRGHVKWGRSREFR